MDGSSSDSTHRYDCIVIGGGQTGLIVGHALREAGIDFVILDANKRVGDAWRSRWDSLRLFTLSRMNGLPGMAFPKPGNRFVGKDEVGDFLERYAEAMELPVQSETRVNRLFRDGDDFVAQTARGEFRAANAIVAMADYQKPHTPGFAEELDPAIVQLHTVDYKNPSQLPDGPVLVVGLGNSGADIALDISTTHATTVAGKESSAIPFRLEGSFGRHLGTRLVRFAAVRVLNTGTPIGRKARKKMITQSAPLVRVRPQELKKAGVSRVGRIAGVTGGKPVTEEGEVLDVSSVVWCTGYKHGFDWVDLPVFDDNGVPLHERGVVADEPGLYFVGLYFLHALWSETITGVQPDVHHIADHLMRHRLAHPVR